MLQLKKKCFSSLVRTFSGLQPKGFKDGLLFFILDSVLFAIALQFVTHIGHLYVHTTTPSHSVGKGNVKFNATCFKFLHTQKRTSVQRRDSEMVMRLYQFAFRTHTKWVQLQLVRDFGSKANAFMFAYVMQVNFLISSRKTFYQRKIESKIVVEQDDKLTC